MEGRVESGKEEEENSARGTSISSDQYPRRPWRCGWAMLGKPLSVVANIPMDPEGAAGSMLFSKLSRCEASPHDIFPPFI